MIVRNYFSHDIPGYGKVWDKLNAIGYCYNVAGENIGVNNFPDDVATQTLFNGYQTANRTRQALITKEIAELVGVADLEDQRVLVIVEQGFLHLRQHVELGSVGAEAHVLRDVQRRIEQGPVIRSGGGMERQCVRQHRGAPHEQQQRRNQEGQQPSPDALRAPAPIRHLLLPTDIRIPAPCGS